MKNKIFIIIIFLISCYPLKAASIPSEIPLDGGAISILLAAGVAYGVKLLRDKKNK